MSEKELKLEDIFAQPSAFDDILNDEQLILYFATPYFDELMAKREALTKQKKEDEALK